MSEDERMEVIEGVDEDGNKVLLQIEKYFFYNGDEYVLLSEAHDCCECDCDCCGHEETEEDEEVSLYVMRVKDVTDENGEEMEEFEPVPEELMDELIQIVQTNFAEDDNGEE